MTKEKLAQLVDRGHELHTEIAGLKEELKTVTAQIKKFAELHPESHEPLADPEREGTRFMAHGSGAVVPVIFTADSIIQKFAATAKPLDQAMQLAGEHFGEFYEPATGYVVAPRHNDGGKFDGKLFRAHARAVLSSPERFISTVTARNKDGVPRSSVALNWADASPF